MDEMLSDYLTQHGLTMAWLAGALGVSRQAVAGWCAGEYRPSLAHAVEIEELTDGRVPARSFVGGATCDD